MRAANEIKTQRARRLRRTATKADALWYRLRSRGLNGYKFVRQLPVGRYFADFACREARLVIEVDGSQHVGRIVLTAQAPQGMPWSWTITARPDSAQNRGFAVSLEQAMRELTARWVNPSRS